jgi:hypothetical protein
MTCGLQSTAVPTSIHCDHLIQANIGAEADLKVGLAASITRGLQRITHMFYSTLSQTTRKFLISWKVPHANTVSSSGRQDRASYTKSF